MSGRRGPGHKHNESRSSPENNRHLQHQENRNDRNDRRYEDEEDFSDGSVSDSGRWDAVSEGLSEGSSLLSLQSEMSRDSQLTLSSHGTFVRFSWLFRHGGDMHYRDPFESHSLLVVNERISPDFDPFYSRCVYF